MRRFPGTTIGVCCDKPPNLPGLPVRYVPWSEAVEAPFLSSIGVGLMPLRDGFTIARSLRRKNNQTPVLFLTAKGEVEDKVRGLDVGGDDYMIKPFSVVELLARLRALLRRQRPQASNLLRFEDLELDLVARQARRADKIIELTNREFALLELLMMTAPRPVSKAVIIERVWNQYFDSQTNVVNVYVNHLRSKIDLPGLVPIVQTVRGVGFALRKADP